jgi:spoIIIJ-associated protein
MEVERSAPTVEEAIDAALAELGITEQEAEVTVVQEGRSGFLRLNSQLAVVRVRPREASPDDQTPTSEDHVAVDSAVEGALEGVEAEPLGDQGERQEDEDERALVAEQADLAADFVEGLLETMGIEADVDIVVSDGITYVDVLPSNEAVSVGALIGKHGATLDAVQELVRVGLLRATSERCRVVVDVEDYRKRRRQQLIRRATEAAQRVRTTGRPERLDPMSSLERKIVHEAVSRVQGVGSSSEGQDPARYVVIEPE